MGGWGCILHKWKIVDCNECEICNLHIQQDIYHLLFHCTKAAERLQEELDTENLCWALENIMLNNVHLKAGDRSHRKSNSAKFQAADFCSKM